MGGQNSPGASNYGSNPGGGAYGPAPTPGSYGAPAGGAPPPASYGAPGMYKIIYVIPENFSKCNQSLRKNVLIY